MNKTLLNKFIKNLCSPSEIDEILRWIDKETDQKLLKSTIKSYWDNLKSEGSKINPEVSQRLDRIHHQININESEKRERGKVRFLSTKNISIVKIFTRAAVILLIPVLTLFIYTRIYQPDIQFAEVKGKQVLNEITSPVGSRTYLELSDGTKVWLNHGSIMKYPQRFNGKNRKVQLVGEGYFEVATNKAKPFVVETEQLSVKVLGTSFNVKAYNDNTDFETSLESGKVEIMKQNRDIEFTVCDMVPGQRFVLDKTTNKYALKSENLSKYVSWKEGILIFEDDNMDVVVERLARWYNVDIVIEDDDLKNLTYTATFIDESLYQILEMLEIVTPIKYKIKPRVKLPNGTYSKKKISIYKQ